MASQLRAEPTTSTTAAKARFTPQQEAVGRRHSNINTNRFWIHPKVLRTTIWEKAPQLLSCRFFASFFSCATRPAKQGRL
jgi:hypothetical protein